MPAPSLTRLDVAPATGPGTQGPGALLLLLHGGKPSSTRTVDDRSASWRRMAALQRAITPGAHEAGVGTWLVRYGARGWNGGAPVADVRDALDLAAAEAPDRPVVLLGHSMGARAAVYAADHPAVVGLVALAPWWQSDDPVHHLAGRPVVAAHGRSDKITSARQTRAFLRRADAVAASTEFVDMGRVGHYMFRRIPAWYDVALSRSLAMLAPIHIPDPAPDRASDPVE